eukprot:Gb_26552 [translate_table: standard]
MTNPTYGSPWPQQGRQSSLPLVSVAHKEGKQILPSSMLQLAIVLSSSEGNILENETAISIISSSKALSLDIAEKQKVAEKTEAKIDEARKAYIPVAKHVALLFFTISSLCSIDPMYQYSLTWYLNFFQTCMKDSAESDDLATRISTLNDYFTYTLFCNISRSLFEKDKLLLSFIIATTIMSSQGKVSQDEFRFLIAGAITLEREESKNPALWLADRLWSEMVQLSKFEAFHGYSKDFESDPIKWKHIYDSPQPYRETLPLEWDSRLTPFQKLLIIRTLRPDKIVASINVFTTDYMGERYVEPPSFDLAVAYHDSSAIVPLVFVLSPGSDPMAALLKFAEGIKQQRQLTCITWPSSSPLFLPISKVGETIMGPVVGHITDGCPIFFLVFLSHDCPGLQVA